MHRDWSCNIWRKIQMLPPNMLIKWFSSASISTKLDTNTHTTNVVHFSRQMMTVSPSTFEIAQFQWIYLPATLTSIHHLTVCFPGKWREEGKQNTTKPTIVPSYFVTYSLFTATHIKLLANSSTLYVLCAVENTEYMNETPHYFTRGRAKRPPGRNVSRNPPPPTVTQHTLGTGWERGGTAAPSVSASSLHFLNLQAWGQWLL